MREGRYSEKKPVAFWITVVVIIVVIAFGAVYTLVPSDNLKTFLGMEEARETTGLPGSWSSLSVSQQEMLAPLEKEWDDLTTAQKKKWLEVAQKAEKMTPEEKQRFRRHVEDWLNLTPEQRRLARQNFLRFKKLAPEKKTERWKEYQKLPEERKRALAAQEKYKRRLSNLSGEPADNKVVEPVKQPEKIQNALPSEDEVPVYWR